jgi:hypothetical protein
MTFRDPRYDILFEPVAIGPVTAKKRFFQCSLQRQGGHSRKHWPRCAARRLPARPLKTFKQGRGSGRAHSM